MSIGTPASPVNAGERPSDPPTAAPPRASVAERIYEALPRTEFYRDLLALQQMGRALEEKVSEFWHAHDNASVAVELMKMGVITHEQYDRDESVMALIDESVLVVEDAHHFLWVLRQFIGALDGVNQDASPTDDEETATEDDAPPCVVAGKGVE